MAYGSSKVRTFDTLKRKTQKIENKNNGGVIGAAGYLAGSAAAGVAGVAEGIIDLGVAFGADITGNHDYAEYVFKDNVVGDWHESITEDYNPDDVIKFGGDVLHGLGQSSWFLLSLIPGAQWLGPAVFGAGMVGQGISSAAEQTGDVGVKEVAYGATTAALETGLETALGGMGKVAKTGVGAIAKATGKSTFQKIASSAARKGLARKIFSDAAGEFAEEFISEYADTFLQKLYQINPNAEYSLTNALYAGAVGAVSGGISAGSVDVISTTARQHSGAKVIKDGNAQTLVNTATHVADKLAASGTNFKHAAEWVRTLRGEVDAYNKLSPEAQKGLRGQTILGEMKASLYFAESQAIHGGIVEKIKNESEENRAALAEYINRSIDKSKRKRDYTAADIAADTDEIATQLGIMNMAGTTFFNFEGAMADMAMERGIESAIEKERASGVKSAQSEAPTAQAAPVDEAFAAAVARTEPEKKTAPETTSPTRRETRSEGGVPVAGETNFVQNAEVSAPNRAAPIENIYEDGAESLPYSGVPEATPGTYPTVEELDIEGRETKYDLTEDGREVMPDSGKPEPPGSAYPSVQKQELEGMTVTDAERAEARARTEKAAKFEQEAQEATEGTETQRSAENVAEAKESGKAAEKSSESKNESTESKKTEEQSGSPKISEAKESLTDEQRAERAKKQADKWIEWEKKTAPTAKELNTAREYVKGFDSLNNRRRLAIIRMIRSSEGVDAQTVKGIANLMAVIPESDLEVRFAKGIGNKGLITKIGNKSVIVLDSSNERKKTIKGTIAHELTHYLENKAGYSTFAKYVRDHAKSEAIEKHKNRYINGWAKIGHDYTEAELDSEITASLVADALNNERFLKRYADRDKKLIQKAFEWLKGFVGRAKNKGKETEEISEITDEMALNLIGLLQSDKTTGESKSGTKYSFSSIAYTFFGEEDMAVGEFTERDYKKTEGYKSYVEECLNNFRQSRGDNFNEAAARKEIEDGIAGIVRVAVAAKSAGYDIYDSAGQRTTRDSKQRLLFSSLEPNSDYFTSSDISTICDKRKNFTEIEAEINRIEAEKGVPREKRFFSDINNFFILHDILAKHGLTTACRQCYVESMRKNLGRMANAFIDLVTETDESNKKNKQLYNNKGEKKSGNAELRHRVRELMADEGLSDSFFTFEMLTDGKNLAELRLQHPLLFEAYNSFYGQSKPKMPKSATPFRFGELTALLTDHNGKINQRLLKNIKSTGGFRLQSYSDFQIKNYVDVLQVIFEAGTLGLNGHAYTKVPAFLDATEGTNLKRNISIFMYRDGDEWKIDRNDSFPWALDKIYDVVNADKSGDTGIIAVSQNEDMSAWIMANDNVGYGIPFHKSGTKMAVVRETVVKTPQGDVKGYLGIKDHTKYQSEVYASGESKGKKVKAPINIYEFWDFNNTRMSRKNLIEKNVKKYIDECERLGYLPKFRDYVINNEKVLQATLAYAKKLGYADANATVEDISFKYKGYTIPYGYYKFLVDFGVFTPEGKASPVKALSLKDYNFDKAVSFFSDSKKLRINELLQQIANGEERDKYRKLMDEGKMTIAELGKVIKDKRDAVVAEVVGETKYDLADSVIDSIGNELSSEQKEYFKKSKVRDKKGNLMVLYHGTTAEFNTFKKGDIGFHFGTKGAARGRVGFGKNVTLKEVYLNITNPILFDEDLGSWDADYRLTRELYDKGILTQAEAESVLFTDDRQYRRTTEGANKKLASVLLEKGYDGIAYSNTFETKKPTTSYIIFNSNQAKEITNKTPTSTPDIRYDLADDDSAYMAALERGDMETAQRMVDEAAKEWGAVTNDNTRNPRPLHLYHGTGTFGFTRFRDGNIYATVSQGVAAGYNRGSGLGKVRSSSLGYIPNDGTVETAIINAKNVLGATLTKLDDVAKQRIISKADSILKEVASKVAELDGATDYEKAGEFFEYLTEKYGEEKTLQWTNQLDNLHYMLATEYTAEEIMEDGKWLVHDLERYHEWKQSLSDLWSEEQDAIKDSTLDQVFKYLLGYEYGDALIDIEYGLGRLINDRQKLVNPNGNLVYLDDIIDSIEMAKNTGIYDLYGHPGEKPLIIDEGKRFWDAIPFENGFRSTDYIVKWANDKGYTSVLFKTVLDPSSGGSENVYADEWVFFNSNQVKSADPVTYDDDGNVIPLSQRFNPEEPDIRYDLADEEPAPKKQADETLNENGEVKDKYFAAAVARAQQGKAPDPEPAEKRAERMIETRKEKFGKLLRQAATIQRKIEKLNNTADKKSNAAHVKKLKQEYREIMMKLEDLQRELREMGYDLNAESRLIERQQKQIEAQGEVIADLKQQKRKLEELEREDRIMRDLAKRESSRIARLYAQQRAGFGNVYDEVEIKRAINDMLERGLISQFFGGQYMPDLSTKQKNGIAEYIAMQLNILGTAEGKQAQNIIHTVANDMIKRMTFTEADTGETLYLDKIVDDDTAKQFTDMIEGDLIGIFQNIGTLNPFSKLQKEFDIVRQKYLDKEKQSKERQEFGKELPKTYQAALKIKKLAAHGKGTFSEAVQLVADELGKMVDESGHLHFGRIDAAMGEVARFFEGEAMKADSERGQLKDEAKIADEGVVWSVNPALQEQVEKYLRLRKGREGQALTAEELKLVGEVLRGMKTTIERYNKEFINGHWVDVETIASNTAEDLLSFVAKDKEYKTKIGAFLGGKVGKNVDQFYFYYILSPETVIEALEGYKQGGLLKSLYHSVRVAKQKAEHRAVQMKKPFAEFLDDKENRWEAQKDQGGREGKSYSYRDKLNVRMINVNGTNITLGEAIYLLMLTKREHAWAGLQNEGFITYDENNKQRERVRVDDIPRVRDLIANQLDKTDIKFLEMAEEFFNKTATKVKEDADMEIFGFTNTQAGYYVPIIRDRYSRMGGVTDARQSIGSIITVYNKSFNQNLVENAKALEGKNIMSIINDHANGLADYAELYLPLKAFDRVYNKVVSTSDGNKSIREILNTKVWNGTELYFKDLFSDIQGHGRKQDHVIDKIVGKARSAWVNSVLGANLKVVATQTTSLGAATQVIEPKYIMPAISVIPQFKGDKIAALRERAYKYSDVIEPRSFDMGAIKAQGNIDKINKIGEKSGFLIGVMDEQICLTIFHAAELKVQDTKKYAIGTEDNARLAAKIADEAIYTTQAMTAASERSAMQRSTSEIARLFSMFTSDSVKNLSHLYGNVMKYIAHSQRVKAGDTSYQAALETDKKEIGRSMRTLAITGVMLGLITQAFKYLFAKEEEEPEDKVKDFAIDIASSTLNILPIVSDMVDKFVFNYDMSMNVLDVLNDSIESLSKGFKTMGKQMSGEYVSTGEAVGVAVDVIKSGASMIGFPIAPAERTITGLMRRFVPSAIYGYDAMFSNPSYTADLKDAVENGDEALAEHILSQLYKNEVNGTYTSAELEEVARLHKAGNTSVIPQKIGAEINGVKLTSAQRKQFTKIYSKASGEVNKLISGSYYSSLNDEQRAKAIKNIYAMFYNRAANEITGKEMTTATAYSYLTSNYAALFASQAYKSGLDEQKDASGNKITVKDQFVDYAANLGLSAEDLLVISYANGVRDKATRAAFLQYLNSLSLTAEIKTQIAERLGFELKDGVIVERTEQ